MDWLVDLISRLNLSCPESYVGQYFMQIIHWLCILFGVGLIVYAKKHMNLCLLVSGLLVGGWLGLAVQNTFFGSGFINPFFYLAGTSVLCAFLMVSFKKLVGMIIGGFLFLTLVYLILPTILESGSGRQIFFLLSFIAGMFIGAVSPQICIQVLFSLIGAIFISYGLGNILQTYFSNYLPVQNKTLVNLIIFLPVLLSSIAYQIFFAKGGGKKDPKEATEE